jgi:hypothetical protein
LLVEVAEEMMQLDQVQVAAAAQADLEQTLVIQ